MTDLKAALRAGMRRLASGVCVIAAQANDKKYAMTASSVTSLSDDPASLLVCINRMASLYGVMNKQQAFSVSVLSASQENISNICAGGEETERFSLDGWSYNDQGTPYLQEAEANFFCSVDNDNYCYGTHQLVIGRVEEVLISERVAHPLLYCDGAYGTLKD